MNDVDRLIREALEDDRHAWSVGTFGAVGEFLRDPDEPVARSDSGDVLALCTGRAAIRVRAGLELRAIAYDTLSSDGETWGQLVAFCLPVSGDLAQGQVRDLGPDEEAVREEDRDGRLFDLGVGLGHVRMCARTRDPELIAALEAAAGGSLFGPAGGAVMTHTLRAQPHRVLLSPVGRIEVFAPIPAPGGQSPEGPHTHLLPKLIATGRTHSANAPIPDGLQPVLMLSPRSPWRDQMGRRTPFDSALDAAFEAILARHGLPEDRAVRAAVEAAVAAGADPAAFAWPMTRRGRAQARITLRRLAQRVGAESVRAWRALYDREPVEADPIEEAALA